MNLPPVADKATNTVPYPRPERLPWQLRPPNPFEVTLAGVESIAWLLVGIVVAYFVIVLPIVVINPGTEDNLN